MDILVRGKEMGIKIYSVEKLQRLIDSILVGSENQTISTRSATFTRHPRGDLGEVLRNEKHGGASEKEAPFASLVTFKGPFIYVHDMEEKYRPTMVREYPKPTTREDGEWPQFRSAGVGKCPFLVDQNFEQEQRRVQKRAAQHEQQRQLQQRREQQIPRTRSHVTVAAPPDPATRDGRRKPLAAVQVTPNPPEDIVKEEGESKSLSSNVERQPSFPPMPRRNEIEFVRPLKLEVIREPAASGIQRSNLTSAIQSQMISSTAATGVKAGTSKEVHQQLKRQVLERTHTASLSVGSIPSSHRMTDLAGALKTARVPGPQRAAKSKAQEKLGGIQEEVDPHEDDIAAERTANASRKKKDVRRDPKPGYCENCRDKYDDFDEVRVSVQGVRHGTNGFAARRVTQAPEVCYDSVELD
jgi:regulatory subunit for Cdc7p protein kinase